MTHLDTRHAWTPDKFGLKTHLDTKHTWTQETVEPETLLDLSHTWTYNKFGPKTQLDPRHTWTRDILVPECTLKLHPKFIILTPIATYWLLGKKTLRKDFLSCWEGIFFSAKWSQLEIIGGGFLTWWNILFRAFYAYLGLWQSECSLHLLHKLKC